jgi:hypothetical protein
MKESENAASAAGMHVPILSLPKAGAARIVDDHYLGKITQFAMKARWIIRPCTAGPSSCCRLWRKRFAVTSVP